MKPAGNRIQREKRTVEKMIHLYCHGQHQMRGALCVDCRELLAHAQRRLDTCVWGENKRVCARCPIHCYEPALRRQMIAVMRYAGPRMLFRHPMLAIGHLIDSLDRSPVGMRRRMPK